MTPSPKTPSNSPRWIGWHGSRSRRGHLKQSDDSFKLVIVRYMWLTGFDKPPLHTMYIDKPMHSHGLMQAIARVNRVFRDKPGGLVVDYLGIAPDLQQAISVYTARRNGRSAPPQAEAIALMMDAYHVTRELFHHFDYSRFFAGTPSEHRWIIPNALEVKRILRQYGYPPDLEDAATDLVLEQAELLAAEWVDRNQ